MQHLPDPRWFIPAVMLYALLVASLCGADPTYPLDTWVEAVYLAEGGVSATYLYGIRSVKYKDVAEARAICKRTIERTLISKRKERCKAGESDLDCLARRYCPINSDTDSGTCKFWADNVKFFLNNK